MSSDITMKVDDLSSSKVIQLLQEHLDDMRKTSPPESVHALDLSGLKSSDITFWSCWAEDVLMGCIALKQHDKHHGEIKSMRTSTHSRNRGIGTKMLTFVLNAAKERGLHRLSLETGTMAFFEPAQKLYAKHGFKVTEPFADYESDPNSMYMTRLL